MDAKKLKELGEIAQRFLKVAFNKEVKPDEDADKGGEGDADKDKGTEGDKGDETFESAKMADSDTMVEYDPSLSVGSAVQVSSATGSVPAPDGTVSLENGVVIVVKDGVIESVTSDGKKVEEKPKPENFEAAVAIVRQEFETSINDIKTTLSDINKRLDAMPTNEHLQGFTASLTTVGNFIKELSETPVESAQTSTVEGDSQEQSNEVFARVGEAWGKAAK